MQNSSYSLIRCQKCLGDLKIEYSHLLCESCKQKYLFDKGLLFMGYNKSKSEFIKKIIETEKNSQANLEYTQNSKDFAEYSYTIGHILSKLIFKISKKNIVNVVDIGCGGAPNSRLLSDVGLQVYSCELEPNSLFLANRWKEGSQNKIISIVCDSTLLPFANNSIDLVFSKEFFHHVFEYEEIFQEINRVLKIGGLVLLKEPTSRFKFLQSQSEKQAEAEYYHNIVTNFKYFNALKQAGFKITHYYLWYNKKSRIKPLNKFRRFFDRQLINASKTIYFLIHFKMLYQRIFSGSSIFIAEKTKELCLPAQRPEIEIVDNSNLVLEEKDLLDPRMLYFLELFEKITKG
jgi:SAM-dependent methyltransferase